MFDILFLVIFGGLIYNTARSRNRSGALWLLLFAGAWVPVGPLGGFLVSAIWLVLHGGQPSWLFLVGYDFVTALVVAFLMDKLLYHLPAVPPAVPVQVSQRRPIAKAAPLGGPNEMSYYLLQNGEETGPVSVAQLREWWHGGIVSPEAQYRLPGTTRWQPIANLAKMLSA